MKFKITWKNTNKIAMFDEPVDVYNYLTGITESDQVLQEEQILANDIKLWCELANAGDRFITDEYYVECVYSFAKAQ